MRLRPLAACALAAVLLVGAGCSEKQSGLGEGQSEPKRAAAPEDNHEVVPPGTSSPQDASARSAPKIAIPKGPPPAKLQAKDLKAGAGAVAKPGSRLSVNYVGVAYSTGKVFDSSFTRGQPIQFQLGAGMVIPGWDQGIKGMRAGGRRQLTIPAKLAYGDQGGPGIKPGETLVFVVDLVKVH